MPSVRLFDHATPGALSICTGDRINRKVQLEAQSSRDSLHATAAAQANERQSQDTTNPET
jgi:hypothetical protein